MLKGLVVLAAIGTAAYWYLSPYVAIHGMAVAAVTKDVPAMESYVDRDRLREHAKSRMSAQLDEYLPVADNALAQIGVVVGRAIGEPVIESAADLQSQPAYVAGELEKLIAESPYAQGLAQSDVQAAIAELRRWKLVREGADKVVAYRMQDGPDGAAQVGFVLERKSGGKWVLVGLES